MSDDKRHAPTATRIAKARREGNVARSAELGALAAFVAALGTTAASLPILADAAAEAVRTPRSPAPYGTLAVTALAPAAAAACAAVAAALLQGAGLRVVAIKIDPRKLDPVAGLKRMCGAEALAAAGKASLGLVAATAIVLAGAADLVATAVGAGGIAAAAVAAWQAALRACAGVVAAGVVLAAADYALARRRWLRGLRMSHEDLKRDARENDGDPHVRAQRRRLHRSLARASVERTRDASFVLVNPTHVAIALRYAPPEVPVPTILVRAADDAALRVRAIARDAGIPVIEEVALARALYRLGDAGEAIPPETYVAVAQVIAALVARGVLA